MNKYLIKLAELSEKMGVSIALLLDMEELMKYAVSAKEFEQVFSEEIKKYAEIKKLKPYSSLCYRVKSQVGESGFERCKKCNHCDTTQRYHQAFLPGYYPVACRYQIVSDGKCLGFEKADDKTISHNNDVYAKVKAEWKELIIDAAKNK